MDTFFRSESLSLCHIYVQNEMAFDIVGELGELGNYYNNNNIYYNNNNIIIIINLFIMK